MSKRELSSLQKAYRAFFLETLHEYEVNSPAQLSKRQKSEFFIRIKKGWQDKKAELLRVNTVKPPVTKNEPYSILKVSRPPVTIAPIVKNKKEAKESTSQVDDGTIVKIVSERNPEQTGDLKINYHPNQFFEQDDDYQYPVVKMPNEGAFLKLPRKGRAMGKGFKEQDFYNAIIAGIPDVEVATDVHLSIPFFNRPYEPDIVLIDRSVNLYIDIEIDEPYDGYYRFPTHELEKDDTRDLFFTESGWVVIRFTERQVHLQEQQCISLIQDVLNSIRSFVLEQTASCNPESQWDYQQAVRWQKNRYREIYLGIENFGKQTSLTRIEVKADEFEAIESNLSRTKRYKSDIPQENIAFEDETHKYYHLKDDTGNAEYVSVTTIIDRFFPFDLERYIQTKARTEEKTEDEIKKEFLQIRDEASEKGTFLHNQIELFLKGEEYNADSKEFAMFTQFYEECIVAQGFEFIEAEKRILLEEYNVAGTVDALFKKPDKEEYIIMDWKRSKRLTIDGHPRIYGYGTATSELSHLDNSSYFKYALQQNIYRYILETEYNMRISSMNLIVLHENNDEYYRVPLKNYDKEVGIILNSINHKI